MQMARLMPLIQDFLKRVRASRKTAARLTPKRDRAWAWVEARNRLVHGGDLVVEGQGAYIVQVFKGRFSTPAGAASVAVHAVDVEKICGNHVSQVQVVPVLDHAVRAEPRKQSFPVCCRNFGGAVDFAGVAPFQGGAQKGRTLHPMVDASYVRAGQAFLAISWAVVFGHMQTGSSIATEQYQGQGGQGKP
jgi:hypothetical protein